MDVSSTERHSVSQTETYPLLMERPESLSASEHIIDIPRSSDSSPSTSHDRTASGLEASSHIDRPSTSVRTSLPQPSTMTSGGNGSNTRNSSFIRRGEARRRRSPLNSGLWISVELVLTISQIVASIVVLSASRNEHPRAPLFPWIVGYASGCVATLPLLYWRYRHRNQVLEQESTQSRQGSTHITVPAGPYSVSVSRSSEADDRRTATTSSRSSLNSEALNARYEFLLHWCFSQTYLLGLCLGVLLASLVREKYLPCMVDFMENDVQSIFFGGCDDAYVLQFIEAPCVSSVESQLIIVYLHVYTHVITYLYIFPSTSCVPLMLLFSSNFYLSIGGILSSIASRI